MKLVIGLLPLLLALSACTIHIKDGGGDGQGGGSSTTTSGTTSSSSGETPDPQTEVPSQIAGRSWIWATTYGAHQLDFTADGHYTSAVFLDAHPGDSCGTEYFTHYAGTVAFADATFTLYPDEATRTKKDSCSDEVLAEDELEREEATYSWRLDEDELGDQALVLTDPEGSESWYYPEGD